MISLLMIMPIALESKPPTDDEIRQVLKLLPDEIIVQLCIKCAVLDWATMPREQVETKLAADYLRHLHS